MASTALPPGGLSGIRIWNRELATYPERDARRMHLLLVVLITITLYYELYVGSGVATIMLAQLKIPFPIFVYILAAGNLLGAFASLLAGLADRFGRANLVVYGLLVKKKLTKSAVESLEPSDQDCVIWDTALPGFGIRVKPSNVKSYIVQYRNRKSGASRRKTIGQHGPLLTFHQAKLGLARPMELQFGGRTARKRPGLLAGEKLSACYHFHSVSLTHAYPALSRKTEVYPMAVLEWGLSFGVVSFVEGIILVASAPRATVRPWVGVGAPGARAPAATAGRLARCPRWCPRFPGRRSIFILTH
jgi:hypothetical protein